MLPIWALEELVALVLGISREQLSFSVKEKIFSFLRGHRSVFLESFSLDQKKKIEAALEENRLGKPWEYILGKVDFYGCSISVDERVLIPRQETEILVDEIVKDDREKIVFLDLCTGSGAIGIAVKKRKPSWEVVISDLSKGALDLALSNCQMNHVDIEVLQGDFLKPFVSRKADCVACNPPYISESEYLALDPSVKDYEPKLALVASSNGFFFYEKLSLELPFHLNPGATVFMEIGASQGDGVKNLFSSSVWSEVKVMKDFSGLDRIVTARFLSC